MNRQKNILLLIPTFDAEGGTQKMVCELGKLLSERYNVYECSFDAYNEKHVFKNENEVLSLNISQGGFLKKIINYPLMALRLHKLKKHFNIDVTISNLWAADLVNIISAGQGKTISIGHGSIIGFAGNRLLLKLKRFASLIYIHFDKVVAVNEYLKIELGELFNIPLHNLTHINNFVAFPKHSIEPAQKPPGLKRLVTIGRMDVMKNHESLIRIFFLLKRKLANIQLVLIGSGSLEKSLLSQAENLGLSVSSNTNDKADLIFTGFNPSPYPLLFSADVFVFPTRSEGLPLVLVEAMYSGLPVVSSDCPTGGPHLILEGNKNYQPGRLNVEETSTGFLMPVPNPFDEETLLQWVNVLYELLLDDNKKLIMAESARKRAKDFSILKARQQWFDLIENL